MVVTCNLLREQRLGVVYRFWLDLACLWMSYCGLFVYLHIIRRLDYFLQIIKLCYSSTLFKKYISLYFDRFFPPNNLDLRTYINEQSDTKVVCIYIIYFRKINASS